MLPKRPAVNAASCNGPLKGISPCGIFHAGLRAVFVISAICSAVKNESGGNRLSPFAAALCENRTSLIGDFDIQGMPEQRMAFHNLRNIWLLLRPRWELGGRKVCASLAPMLAA